MAYPNFYTPYQSQYVSQMQTANQQNQNGLIWVQGEAGAKSYLVAPGATVMLMDSESQRFYLKTSDASGMPLPLRVFEYTEKTGNAVDLSTYATRADLDAFREEINSLLKEREKEDE